MAAYAFYYTPKVCNSKDMTKTIEQPAYQMNMVQHHNYLDVNENPIALDISTMALHP
jgi:hypothetical protein